MRDIAPLIGKQNLPPKNAGNADSAVLFCLSRQKLARHGWRKLMPRPFHPKRDLAAQDAFKKTIFQML
jgi:Winged helix-turn helix